MKIIELKNRIQEVPDCYNCPMSFFDPYYSMSTDSGHDCAFLGRIADDRDIARYEEKMQEINKQNASLFKYKGEIPKDPMIPGENCPLKDKE